MLAGVNLAPQDANVSTMRFAIMYSGGRCSANLHAPFYNVHNAAYSYFTFLTRFRFSRIEGACEGVTVPNDLGGR